MAIDSTPPPPDTRVLADTHDPIGKQSQTARNKRRPSYDPGVIDPSYLPSRDDPDFDWSLVGSHNRLVRALARRSEALERMTVTGKANELEAAISQCASAWKTLMSTQPKADPLDQQPGEDDDAYRARLEAAAK